MKLTDKEIAESARRLRDEENARMEVGKWQAPRHRRYWPYLVIPAAAVIGFIFGAMIHPETGNTEGALARIDTVYINTASPDSGLRAPVTNEQSCKVVRKKETAPAKKEKVSVPSACRDTETGCSVENDDIDYSLLVDR